MKSKNIIIVLLSVFTISCEKKIDFDFPDYDNLLVVNSIIYRDKPISFRLTRSIPILSKDTLINENNAVIDIFCNNNLIESVTKEINGEYFSNIIPQEKKNYNIKILCPNFNSITSSTVLPDKPQINSIVVDSIDDFPWAYNLQIDINDNTQEQSFYLIKFKGTIINQNPEDIEGFGKGYFDYLFFRNKTQILNDINSSTAKETINLILGSNETGNDENLTWIAFSNDYFSENFHKITVDLGIYKIDNKEYIYIYLSKITEDYFKYLKTIELNKIVGDSPFSEPVQIYNNIIGGVGIFAGENILIDSIMPTN